MKRPSPSPRGSRTHTALCLALGLGFARAASGCGEGHLAPGGGPTEEAGSEADPSQVEASIAHDARSDVETSPDAPTDAAPPTWCDTLSPRPAFCADFDGVDPWAGWNVAPLTAPWPTPPRWGFVGLTDAGASSSPFALDVTFASDAALPGQEGGSRFTRGLARAGALARARTTYAFDLTLLAEPGVATVDPILGGLVISPTDASAPSRAWAIDLGTTYPDDAGLAWLFVPWTLEAGAAPERFTSSVPLRVGVRTRVELSVARPSSEGAVDIELHLTPESEPRQRGISLRRRDVTFAEDEIPAIYVENRVQIDSPHWRAIWDNITLSVE